MTGLAGKRVLVLGAGASGCAAAQLALAQGARVTVLDGAAGNAASRRCAALQAQGVEFRWG